MPTSDWSLQTAAFRLFDLNLVSCETSLHSPSRCFASEGVSRLPRTRSNGVKSIPEAEIRTQSKMKKSSKGKAPANGSKPPKKGGVANANKKTTPKDPVEVYCRVRPLQTEEQESCAELVSDCVLQITPPPCSLAYRSGHYNGTQHVFKHVFDDHSNQTEVFERLGLPLVEDLLEGKNGLLFAYGITNSGKTYSMTGEPGQPGVLPRCLDVIFNSIADVQSPRCVFRPDRANSFDVFTEAEARLEHKRTRPKKISGKLRAEQPEYGDLLRIPEPRRVEGPVDEDNGYSVFVSYIEIYNNYVFDLLEELPFDPIKPRAPQSRSLREDAQHVMFVNGVTEVEVKSTEEAFDVIYRGQKRRRVAQTQLNHESSRSHSVFNIRLVQAPLDPSGEEVLQDKTKVSVSQLSLVDLAGSERTSRTHSAGDRLREAGSINASLMVLRTCMETLRDNQLNEATRIVPYRDSKLTHLFKNYFDGEGKVRMIVCVSPQSEDYDETIHVMRFAEVTQEVVVDRAETVRQDLGLAPGRRRANILYKAALKEAISMQYIDTASSTDDEVARPTFDPCAPHPYHLALGVLSVQKYLEELGSESSLAEFRAYLEGRQRVRSQLIEDLHKKQQAFRLQLLAQEQELSELRTTAARLRSHKSGRDQAVKELGRIKGIISTQDERIARLSAELEQAQAASRRQDEKLSAELEQARAESRRLAGRLDQVSQEKSFLVRTTEMYEADKRDLEHELEDERQQRLQGAQEKEQFRRTMQGFVSQEKDKFERLTHEMRSTEKVLASKDRKLRQVKELIRNSPCAGARTPLRDSNHPAPQATSEGGVARTSTGGATASDCVSEEASGKGQVPIKPTRKRSLSENWLEHKPPTTIKDRAILQPQMKKKKTVSTPTPRDFHSQKVDKYCLQHQEEDSEGDVKTELYKGEIVHTRGGGTSVQFTDVEVLKHARPRPGYTPRSARRSTRLATRRHAHSSSSSSGGSSEESSMEEQWTDVETRCAVAISGNGKAKPAFAHTVASRAGHK